jgi:hypothetical protein
MAGGQRIDDHGFWAGSKGKDSVFPDGPHKTKDESSAEGAGHVGYYEDTTEAIKKVQMKQVGKIKGRPMGAQEFH